VDWDIEQNTRILVETSYLSWYCFGFDIRTLSQTTLVSWQLICISTCTTISKFDQII
jgi:hypothetical protein